jgi:hypothetical protein
MDTIKLGTEVIVSDPCYEIPTWCQAVVRDVLPGNYITEVEKTDLRMWGNRISRLRAIHEDYLGHQLIWKEFPATIGVDSGQAGIFSKDSYRNDGYSETIPHGDGEDLGIDDGESGDKWYNKMCSRTLGDKCWGVYPEGVVSSSGVGDGSYILSVAKVDGKIVGFEIDFGLDYSDDDDEMDDGFGDDEFDPAGGRGLHSHE